MSLYVSIQGSGPALVLLHGWSLHGGIWRDFLEDLETHFTVYNVDLPGHGKSPYMNQITLASWVNAVVAVTPEKADWIGWSLGGLVATGVIDQHPERVKRLLLLASNPCFIRKPGWDSAVDFDVFSGFADELENDFEKVLLRFLALQVTGSRRARATLKSLQSHLLEKPSPDSRALRAALELLRSTDYRALIASTEKPVYWLSGARDTLVPFAAANCLSGVDDIYIIDDAGHAPFISHANECLSQILRWFN